jgi:hypothetical protein
VRPWWRRAPDTSAEARAELARLTERESKVVQLAKELREMQRRNNFSGMVAEAIAKAAEGA